jgi:(4S)-4-hydroxy-5-phosphonooxypentane-2,3-dione isomerase
MFAAVIRISVKPEYVDAFREATLENARHSILEPGILRFDVLQDQQDPTQFVLYEIYLSPEAQLKHRETAHYLTWREKAEPMMAAPRVPTKYDLLNPPELPAEKL